MNGLLSAVVTLLGGYALIVAVVFFAQSSLLYFPTREVYATPDAVGLRYEDVRFTSSDGVALHGWYLPARKARGTLLFCHGNAGNITHRLDSLLVFNELGLNTFIFDYRGYGQSDGTISEQGSYLDARAALRYLKEVRGVAPTDLIYFGRSLGGAVATWLATVEPPSMLILESTFTSIPDLAVELYPFLPARQMSRFRYDAKSDLESVDRPVLIVHSRDDEIIGIHHGRALWAAARGPKDFLELRGSHNEGFLRDRTHYVEGLRAFIERHRAQGSGATTGFTRLESAP